MENATETSPTETTRPAEPPSVVIAGVKHQLRLGFRALMQLEAETQGIQRWMQMLDDEGRRFTAIQIGLVAGLLHEKPKEEAFEEFRDRITESLEPGDLGQYSDALMAEIARFTDKLTSGSRNG